MDPLTYSGITTEQKMYLGALTKHPGWVVYRKLIDDCCEQYNRRVIKLNREEPEYLRKLEAFQNEAHVANEFAATLIKSVIMHSQAGELEDQLNKLQEKVDEANPEFGTQFGSIRRNTREGKQ